MRRRRSSGESETSTDSWSVIQKIVESREPSHYEIEIESSLDSEHWDSDSEDPQDNDEDGNDSLEEFGPSQETDDNETGDCEIVDEEEAMQMSCSRYFISAEKIRKSLDLLDSECCSNFSKLFPSLFPLSRDVTRAMAMLFITASAAILFTKSVRVPELHTAQRPHEAFAPGQQSREGFERAFAPLLVRRSTLNISRSNLFQCERWEKFTRSPASSWPKPSQPVKTLPSVVPVITNSTPFLEIDEETFFTRPMTTVRLSISLYTKQQPSVCQQDNEQQAQGTLKRPEVNAPPLRVPFQNSADLLHKRDEPSLFVGPSSSLAVAPISISRIPKADADVCVQNMKRKKVPSFVDTILTTRNDSLKRIASHRLPTVVHKKSLLAIAKRDFVLLSTPSTPRPSCHKKRLVAPCVPIQRPCVERDKMTNEDKKHRKVSSFVLAKSTITQPSNYKRRPLGPSQPVVPSPCVGEKDSVKCWRSINYDQKRKSQRDSAEKRLNEWLIR